MPRQCIVYRTIEDCYSPDGEEIEVEIEVEFTVTGADPDVGIMSAGAEDICVKWTDSDQCDAAQAQAWLDGGSASAERALDRICDFVAEAEYDDRY